MSCIVFDNISGAKFQTSNDNVQLETRCKEIRSSRKRVLEATGQQANQMLKRSKIDLPAAKFGDNVVIPILSVHRSKCDPRNLIGVILSKDEENDHYKIWVVEGILKGTYMRNAFTLCEREHFLTKDVPEESVSLREATKFLPGGGQGLFHCECRKQCSNNRCKCFKQNRLCNSRCHHGSEYSCNNKS